MPAVAEAAVAEERSQLDERLGNRVRVEVRERELVMPGESTIHPPAGSPGSRCSELSVVVWRPLPSARETSPTRAAAPGTSALTIVLLPMPDWPTSTLCSPSTRARAAGATSCFADSGITS